MLRDDILPGASVKSKMLVFNSAAIKNETKNVLTIVARLIFSRKKKKNYDLLGDAIDASRGL